MHRDSNREITGIELERYFGRDGNRTREWFASNGFRSSLTTIRPKMARKVNHNRFEDNLARCSIYDLSNNKILSDESVVNGGTYQLIYHQGIYILDEAIPMRESSIELPKIQETNLSREMASLKKSVRRLDEADSMRKRSIDSLKINQQTTNRLSREVASLKANIGTLNTKMDEINPESFPRFHVWRSQSISERDYEPLIFDETKYNDGGMYSAWSGKATAKYDGMYIFSTSLLAKPNNNILKFFIYVNDERYAKSST